jgi:hypothetical protein
MTGGARDSALVFAERAVLVAATAVAIYGYGLALVHGGALWRDEMNSIRSAGPATLADVWHLIRFESFPIAWVLVLRAWMATGIGATDLGLRVFGLLGGLAFLGAIWFAVRRLSGSAPVACLALIAVNPEMLRWTSSVRAWGVGAALTIFALVLVREASVTPAPRRIVLAIVVAALAVNVTYQNAFLLAGIAIAASLVALWNGGRRSAVVPLGIGAAAAASLLPYLGVFRHRAGLSGLNDTAITLGDLAAQAWDVVASSGVTVGACCVALIAAGLAAALRRKPGHAAYVMTAASFATAALLAFYVALRYPTQPWYFVAMVSLAAVCGEIAMVSVFRERPARICRVVLAGLVLIAGAGPARRALHEPHTNIDVIAGYLNVESRPGDLVVAHPWYLAITLSRYYPGPAEVVTVPALDDYSVHRYDLIKAAMLASDPVGPVLAKMRRALESGHQVWVVGDIPADASVTPSRPPPPPLPGSAWNSGPYEDAWAKEAGAFIAAHVLNRRRLMPKPGGRYESEALVVLTGWK